jgi:hypothetical protein
MNFHKVILTIVRCVRLFPKIVNDILKFLYPIQKNKLIVKPTFQTFILEQILTPSGLIDGSDFDEIANLDNLLDIESNTDPTTSPEILEFNNEEIEIIPFTTTETITQFESGVFTVGETGKIEIDYLYDGGGYQGELAIFSIEGMEVYTPGSREFILEAAHRALGNDPDAAGQVVISDINEGAKLSGRYLAEGNFNQGEYSGTTKVTLNPGERFAFMLVPNGTVQQVYDGLDYSNGELAKSLRPLFSLSTANPEDGLSLGQIADVTGNGHTFVMEDMRVDGWTDEDYNDIIFQVKGATGEAVALDEVIDPALDWRETELGEDLYEEVIPDFPQFPIDPTTGTEYVPGELLVKFEPNMSDAEVENVAQSYGAVAVERLVHYDPNSASPLQQWRLISFEIDTNMLQIRDTITREIGVVTSEFNMVRSLHWEPNDTRFDDLWALNNTGQFFGTEDADINAVEAWDLQRGNRDIVVAVIDTGVDYTHPDLAANMWRNPGEIEGDGIDNNGKYGDDVYGYDFGDGDDDPMPESFGSSDYKHYAHGTHVAGTIGAVGDNDRGVVGVSPEVSLMALKVRDSIHWKVTSGAIAPAIDYAVEHGANIINISMGATDKTQGYSDLEYDALSYANSQNVLVVTSAGNDDSDNDVSDQYPANYDLPNIITVAATDNEDKLLRGSNYGATTVDLGAPGEMIWSTIPGNEYEQFSGTSMAAPHVAGAAALLLADHPTWTPTEIKTAILNNADKKNSLQGKTVSGGRLNLYNAILNSRPPVIVEGVSSVVIPVPAPAAIPPTVGPVGVVAITADPVANAPSVPAPVGPIGVVAITGEPL